MALSIASSEKNTRQIPPFPKKINTCCQTKPAPHRSDSGFPGEHDFGPETTDLKRWRETNTAKAYFWKDWSFCLNFDLQKQHLIHKIKLHLPKQLLRRADFQTKKIMYDLFVVAVVGSLILSLWPGTALPDSRHLPGHDAPLPLRNWWTTSSIENNHSLGTCNGRLVFQRVHYRIG